MFCFQLHLNHNPVKKRCQGKNKLDTANDKNYNAFIKLATKQEEAMPWNKKTHIMVNIGEANKANLTKLCKLEGLSIKMAVTRLIQEACNYERLGDAESILRISKPKKG